MSYSIDLNLLLYSIDEDSRFHKKAKAFLRSIIHSEETCFLSWETIYGFLRIATNPRIFRRPLSMKMALENIQSLMAQPGFEMIAANKNSWEIFVRLTEDVTIKGNLVSDAVLAAILETNGVKRLYTHDTDYRKFSYLNPVDPLADIDC